MKLHTSAGKMSLPLEEPHVWFAIHEIELLIPYTINYINFLNKEITINGKAACLSGDLLFSSFFCPMLHSCSCLFLRRTIKSTRLSRGARLPIQRNCCLLPAISIGLHSAYCCVVASHPCWMNSNYFDKPSHEGECNAAFVCKRAWEVLCG